MSSLLKTVMVFLRYNVVRTLENGEQERKKRLNETRIGAQKFNYQNL